MHHRQYLLRFITSGLSQTNGSTLASLCCIFFLMLLLNGLTPLWGDDWWRAVAIQDFLDIFKRITDEYLTWTGRLSVLFLTFLFLLKYPGSVWLFNIVNSLVFCVLMILIFRAAVGRAPGKHRRDFVLVLLIFCATWFCTQALGEAVFWKTGAIAYLWVVTAAIGVLTPFVNLTAKRSVLPDTHFRLWAYPLLAFFWAMSLENVAVSCTIFMLYSLAIARFRRIKLTRWYWRVVVGQLLGCLVLVVAPGNYARFAAQDDGQAIWLRLGQLADVVWHHGSAVTYVFLLMAVCLIALSLMRQRFVLKSFYLWLIIGLTFALSMAGSTGINFANRTAFVAEICFIVALANLGYLLLAKLAPLYVYPLPLLLMILILWLADFTQTLEQYLATWQQSQRRAELMASYKAQGIQRIVLPSMKIPQQNGLKDDIVDRQYFLRDIHPDQPGNAWRNSTYARYHGFEFANRIKKPYAIYQPELTQTARFRPVVKKADFQLYLRRQKYGFKRHQALFYLGKGNHCRLAKQLRVYPQNPNDLAEKNRQQRYVRVAGQADVAWISAQGSVSNERCILRYTLPSWSIARIAWSKHSIDWQAATTGSPTRYKAP